MRTMTGQVLTEVSAVVAVDREAELVAAYREVIAQPVPDGLLRTELLSGVDGHWRIQTLWRDHAALDAMRASAEGRRRLGCSIRWERTPGSRCSRWRRTCSE